MRRRAGEGWLRWLALCILLLAGRADGAAAYDLVVAQDGSGDFTTVQAAILAVPARQASRTRIYIKAGTYREKITVPKDRLKVTLLGENRDTTVLAYDDFATGNRDGTVPGTADTPSFDILAKDFAARDLTFANTAGNVGTAIAVWAQGNRPHFRNCAFLGYQDTLCTDAKYAYFQHCYIEGAVDFIFGRSTAIFQGCTIHSLDDGFLTAADQYERVAYGFLFQNCTIYGDAGPGSVYLGRAWGQYARVVYADCTMDDSVVPAGWDDWGDPTKQDTAFFAEYDTSGDGADPVGRVDWSHQLTADEYAAYTLASIFNRPENTAGTTLLVSLPKPWYNAY